jgi:hypothetical protein
MERIHFVKQLAKERVEPQLNKRLMNNHLPRELRLNISRILQKPLNSKAPQPQPLAKQMRCGKCPNVPEKTIGRQESRVSTVRHPFVATVL